MQCENDCKRVVVTNSLAIAVGAVAILLLLFAVPSTQAQTYTVMHNFAAGLDGYGPIMGLIQDRRKLLRRSGYRWDGLWRSSFQADLARFGMDLHSPARV